MATKIAPKKAVKATTKTDAAAKAKEAEKAERAKVVESVVPALAEKVEAIKEHEEGVKTSLLDLVDTAQELKDENDLTKDELSVAVRTAYAETYGVKLEDVSNKGKASTQYFNAVKIVRFVFPENEKALASARKKGFGFNDLYKVATSGEIPKGAKPSQGRGGDTRAKSDKKNVFESIEDVGTALAGDVSKALKSGFDLEEIETAFAGIIAEWAEKSDEGEGEDEDEKD